jgi:hypothetical protein
MPAIPAGMTKICILILCGRAQANDTLRGDDRFSKLGELGVSVVKRNSDWN